MAADVGSSSGLPPEPGRELPFLGPATGDIPEAPPTIPDVTLSEATLVMPVPASVAFEGLDVSYLQTRTAIATTSYLAAVLRLLTPSLQPYVERAGSLPRFDLPDGWFDEPDEGGLLAWLERTGAETIALVRSDFARCRALCLRFVLEELAGLEWILLWTRRQVLTCGRVRARLAHRANSG